MAVPATVARAVRLQARLPPRSPEKAPRAAHRSAQRPRAESAERDMAVDIAAAPAVPAVRLRQRPPGPWANPQRRAYLKRAAREAPATPVRRAGRAELQVSRMRYRAARA